MIIYTVTTHVRVSHQSSAVTRRNIYDYPLGDSELSRVSHQSNVSRDGTSMTIHWVNQSCHVLATKAMMSRDGASMTIHWVTRSCHVLATKASVTRWNIYDYPLGETADGVLLVFSRGLCTLFTILFLLYLFS